MNAFNRVLFTVFGSLMLLHLLILSGKGIESRNSFLGDIQFAFFLSIYLFGFVIFLCYIRQLEENAWFHAATISMFVLPTLVMPFISNLSYELLNHYSHVHLHRALFIVLTSISLYFPIANLRQKKTSLFRRIFPFGLLLVNLFFFLYLIISNDNQTNYVNSLERSTYKKSVNMHISVIEQEDVESFSRTNVESYSDGKNKLYRISTSLNEDIEISIDVEPGDSIVKRANTNTATLIKPDGSQTSLYLFF